MIWTAKPARATRKSIGGGSVFPEGLGALHRVLRTLVGDAGAHGVEVTGNPESLMTSHSGSQYGS